MDKSYLSTASLPLIPLSSEEPLWEWDLVSDAVFFSEGAEKLLHLSSSPFRMDDFLKLVDSADLPGLTDSRAAVINGNFRGVAEHEYACNGQRVHEHIFPLSRNSSGNATRLLGRLSKAPHGQLPLPFYSRSAAAPHAGVWLFHIARDRIWLDGLASDILGFQDRDNHPDTSNGYILRIHPAERAALLRDFELLIHGEIEGNSISDICRFQNSQGHYTPVLLRASVLERDPAGQAVIIAGMVSPSGHEPEDSPFSRDDRLFHALNSMGVGQWNWDAQVRSVWYCPRYLAILGYPAEDSATFRERWHLLVHPDDLPKIEKVRKSIISSPVNGDTFECTYRMKDANGSWVWIFDRGCVTRRDADGRAGHMVGSITNITTAQLERDKLEELVRHDSLTGLRSRAFCKLEVEHIEQNNIRPVSAISVDITGLKMINDSMGHAIGDELLTKASSILRGSLRASDFIARTGGDEFLVLLPNCDFAKGQKLLKKIQSSFDTYNAVKEHMPVIAACGLASVSDMSESVKSVIARADQEMYRRKKESRQADQAILRGWIKSHTGREVAVDDRLGDEGR